MVGAQRGFTLVELMIALAVLALAFMGLIGSILYATRMNAVNRETTAAMRACEQVVETMEGGGAFGEIYARYNGVAADNAFYPYGAAPAMTFDVLFDGRIVFEPVPAGTQRMFFPWPGDPDGRCGRIQFPENPAGTLNETAGPAPPFGLAGNQNDMNNNGSITDANVNATYRMLPVVVTLEWRGVGGANRSVRYMKVIAAR